MTADEAGPAAAMRDLRSALDGADLGLFEQLFVEDVRWLGVGGGGCWDRDEVMGMLGAILAGPTRPTITDLRAIGTSFLVQAELPGDGPGDEPWTWVATALVGSDGRIVSVQDYESAAIAEHDLGALTASRRSPVTQPSEAAAVVAVALVPFLDVSDVSRTVAFYGRFGLSLRRSHEDDGQTVWAFLDSGTAALMVAASDEPIDAKAQDVVLWLYTQDLAALREQLLAGGIQPGEILDGSPGPPQQMRVVDPDGYRLAIAQIDDITAGGQHSTALRAIPPAPA